MKNYIFAFILGLFVAVAIPVLAQIVDREERIIAPMEFQYVDLMTRDLSTYTIEELQLKELKQINEKLGNLMILWLRKE